MKNLLDTIIRSGKKTASLEQMKTVAQATENTEALELLNKATVSDLVKAKKYVAAAKMDANVFGQTFDLNASGGAAFGLEGDDRTIASEDQKKIFTPKKLESTADNEERRDFRERQKTEVWNPETSDVKAAVTSVSEALKAKPDFPEILNRAEKDPVEKRDEKSAKAKAGSKKVASLGEALHEAKIVKHDPNTGLTIAWFGGHGVHAYDDQGTEVDFWNTGDFTKDNTTPEEQVETSIQNKLQEWQSEATASKKDKVKRIAGIAKQAELNILWTDAGIQVYIDDANETSKIAAKKTVAEFPFSTEDNLLDGFTYQELIDAVISNEEVRDPQAIGRTFDEMLANNTKNAEELFNTNLKKILSEIAAYEKAGSKKTAEFPLEKEKLPIKKEPLDPVGDLIEEATGVDPKTMPKKEPKEPKEKKLEKNPLKESAVDLI
jgi:hypothetical protein